MKILKKKKPTRLSSASLWSPISPLLSNSFLILHSFVLALPCHAGLLFFSSFSHAIASQPERSRNFMQVSKRVPQILNISWAPPYSVFRCFSFYRSVADTLSSASPSLQREPYSTGSSRLREDWHFHLPGVSWSGPQSSLLDVGMWPNVTSKTKGTSTGGPFFHNKRKNTAWERSPWLPLPSCPPGILFRNMLLKTSVVILSLLVQGQEDCKV